MRKNGFYAILARMRYIARWSLMRNSQRESLSEHSYDVAVLAHALALIGRTHFGSTVDPAQCATAALFHDVPEILTGDLPTPVKYHSAQMREAYRAIERGAGERLLEALPEELRPAYGPLLSPGEGDAVHRYVKAADKISAYLKCVAELRAGNREFERAAAQLERAISALALPEADYFMAQFAAGYSLTLDELQEEQ